MYTLELTEEELVIIQCLFEQYTSLYDQGNKQERWEQNRYVTHQTGIEKDRTPEQTYKLVQNMRKRFEGKLRAQEMGY